MKLGVGEHFGNPELMANYEGILHWMYFHGWVIVLGICTVKISVGFFLLRLVQGKWYKASEALSYSDKITDSFVAVHHHLDIILDSFHACLHWNS